MLAASWLPVRAEFALDGFHRVVQVVVLLGVPYERVGGVRVGKIVE